MKSQKCGYRILFNNDTMLCRSKCVVFYSICLLTHCMYKIHSKAKLSVIDIEKAIKKNVIISNIASPPNS